MAYSGSSTTSNDASQSASGIFAKLQLLFPSLPSPKRAATLPPPATPIDLKQEPKYLKVHIVTWNMHDSLPKGNLTDLLGSVPAYVERKIDNDDERFRLPNISLNEGHPYHIVVVGGQECPTLSGIPMGLAANFRHRDSNTREFEKSKVKGKGIEHIAEPMPPDPRHEHPHHHHPKHRSADGAVVLPTTSSWSAVLEDWFSNGLGSLTGIKPVITSAPVGVMPLKIGGVPFESSPSNHQPNVISVNWEATDSVETPCQHNTCPKRDPSHNGPYQLLVKERLMGIYIAVFVHRDIYSLVKGVSTDTVPTGLIGGRLGNKGGVGVSMNLNGINLLFINAHLAAHDGNIALRVANLTKIKTELTVESFLPPSDPRVLKEDATEKFDYTWIFGDLNFRLDITRQHADWLIARKEFNKAFAFDQLNKLVKSRNPVFEGFQEAEIDFPPTFKYNTPHRRHGFHRVKPPNVEVAKEGPLPEVAGSASSMSSDLETINIRGQHDPSSAPTLLSHIASRTKYVLDALNKRIRAKNIKSHKRDVSGRTGASVSRFSERTELYGKRFRLGKRLSFFPYVRRQASAWSFNGYDSSSKRRVPSWCDRILWKTTVKLEERDSQDDARTRSTRLGRMLRPSKLSNPSSDTVKRHTSIIITPKASTKSLHSRSKNRTASCDLRINPSKEQNGPDPVLAARPRSVSIAGDYQKYSDLTSSKTIRKVLTGPSPESALSGASSKRWLPQLLTKDPRALGTTRSNSLKVKHDPKTSPRQGELVCLSYHTVNDEQMARLEGGWSDHRPVIGSYAIYL